MKRVAFCKNALETIRNFPLSIKRAAGYQLDRVQRDLSPNDWKPMPTIGKGVKEIRLHDHGQYRIIYLATFKNTVYVLHAFRKKSQKTRKLDINKARVALKNLLHEQMT